MNVNNLNIGNFCKAVDTVFTASLVHGIAGWPFDNSLAAKVQSYVGRIGTGAVRLRVSEAPTLAIAFLRRLKAVKELKRNGVLRDPLRMIAAQRVTLHRPPQFLQSVLTYRTLEWARSLTLNARPARTRGGIILDLHAQLTQEAADAEISKILAVNAFAIRYGASGLWT